MRSELAMAISVFPFALLTSATLTWLVWQWMVSLQMGQTVRDDGPETHLKKMGTPTLGGLGFMVALVLAAVLWGLLDGFSLTMLLVLGLALGYALIGLADDWPKVRMKRSLGLKARVRLPLEFLLAGVFAWLLVHFRIIDNSPAPWQILNLQPGLLWGLFAVFVIVGGANAVNLTDGLDGLAGGVSAIVALGLSVVCIAIGRFDLAAMSVAVAGVCAGFLWLNAAPAQIFMGDVGALGLGAALAGIAVAGRMELIFGFFGIVFVIEALSVIIQVLYFRATKGKRFFRMAPFHHHLELGGMPETRVTARLWLVTIAAVMLVLGFVSHVGY